MMLGQIRYGSAAEFTDSGPGRDTNVCHHRKIILVALTDYFGRLLFDFIGTFLRFAVAAQSDDTGDRN